MKTQPFQVAVNTSPQDGQAWLLVSWPGIHAPSNLLPQPGQFSGECSVILIPGQSSPLPAGRPGTGVAAAVVTGWLIIQIPVPAAVLMPWHA
jgi:hypothetical protein